MGAVKTNPKRPGQFRAGEGTLCCAQVAGAERKTQRLSLAQRFTEGFDEGLGQKLQHRVHTRFDLDGSSHTRLYFHQLIRPVFEGLTRRSDLNSIVG